MSRTGENIYKRKDGRWEARYIDSYDGNGKAKYKFKDAFEAMGYMLFCENMDEFKEKTYGLFGDFDWKEFLQKEFNIDMSDI